MGTNLYPLQLSIVNDLILGLRLDHHNVSHLCTRAGADSGLFDVAVSCAARELDTGGTYRTRLIAVPDVDGLVYNYGNSVCENFSGDAKNVLNFSKRAH